MQATPPPISLTLMQVETTLRVLPSRSLRSTEQVVTVKGIGLGPFGSVSNLARSNHRHLW